MPPRFQFSIRAIFLLTTGIALLLVVAPVAVMAVAAGWDKLFQLLFSDFLPELFIRAFEFTLTAWPAAFVIMALVLSFLVLRERKTPDRAPPPGSFSTRRALRALELDAMLVNQRQLLPKIRELEELSGAELVARSMQAILEGNEVTLTEVNESLRQRPTKYGFSDLPPQTRVRSSQVVRPRIPL